MIADVRDADESTSDIQAAEAADSLQKLKDDISNAAESEDEKQEEKDEDDGEIEWNFDFIDADKNGMVTKREYREALQKFHKEWTYLDSIKQVESVFKRADHVSTHAAQ